MARSQHRPSLPLFRSAVARALVGGAVIGGALAVFAEVSDDQTEEDGRRFDRQVLSALRENDDPGDAIGPDWLCPLARGASMLGNTGVVAALSAATAGALVLMARRRQAGLVVATFVVSLAASEGLKAIYNRGRPPAAYRLVDGRNSSFPSGHALLATVAYLTIAALASRSLKGAHKVATMATGALLAGAAGASRIYLGVHWFADVVAGWAAGCAVASASLTVSSFKAMTRSRASDIVQRAAVKTMLR